MTIFTRIAIIAALLFFPFFISAQEQTFQYETERALAENVLTLLQEGDREKFSALCIDEKRMESMLAGMTGTSEMEVSIRGDLSSEADPAVLRDESLTGFNKALELIQTEDFQIEESVYPEQAFYQTRFEVTNSKCIKLKADISSNKNYSMILYLFRTEEDLFIYDFNLIPNEL